MFRILKRCGYFAIVLLTTSASAHPGENCITSTSSTPPRPVVTMNTPMPAPGESPPEILDPLVRETRNFNSCLDSWIGTSINVLILAWGAPHNKGGLPDGSIYYVWEERSGDRHCRTTIFVKKLKISSWKSSGNDCMRAVGPSAGGSK